MAKPIFIIATTFVMTSSVVGFNYRKSHPVRKQCVLRTTEAVTTETGRELISSHANVDRVLQSGLFRNDRELPSPSPISTHPKLDREPFYDTNIEMQMIRDKKCLDQILQSSEYRSTLTGDDMMNRSFEETELGQHAALANLMKSSDFKHSLDVQNSSSTPFHSSESNVSAGRKDEFDVRNSFSIGMIAEREALNDLMHGPQDTTKDVNL